MARALPGDDLSRIPIKELHDELARRDRKVPGPIVDLRLPKPPRLVETEVKP